MAFNFAGLRVLVTAGPTWTPVDRVRVLTSVFSGETGLRLARHFQGLGADVTLLMGPGRAKYTTDDWTSMRIHQFFYFEELKDLLETECSLHRWDLILHSSAVSDFTAAEVRPGKTSSKRGFNLKLVPTPKLVDAMRAAQPDAFMVKFKLQVGLTDRRLLTIALRSLHASSADLIVANNLDEVAGEQHRTFVINPDGDSAPCATKKELCDKLTESIAKGLSKRKLKTAKKKS